MILVVQGMALLWVKKVELNEERGGHFWGDFSSVLVSSLIVIVEVLRVSSAKILISLSSKRSRCCCWPELRLENWLFSSQKRPQAVTMMICFLGAEQRKTEFSRGSGQFVSRSSRFVCSSASGKCQQAKESRRCSSVGRASERSQSGASILDVKWVRFPAPRY